MSSSKIITMVEDILLTYKQLGKNTLHLPEIYKNVREIREARGMTIENDVNFKAHIRYILQTNKKGRGKSCFKMVKKYYGEWALTIPLKECQ